MTTALAFDLPERLHASVPPEARGLARDEVRLLVARGDTDATTHAQFRALGKHLRPGDLLVVNTSATIPAALDGQRSNGQQVAVHFSTPTDDGGWLVELRSADGSHRVRDVRTGEVVALPAGVTLRILDADERLSLAHLQVEGPVTTYLEQHGRPISYGYVPQRWPLSAYQTVFARDPGSAEMPSAGRPFTTGLVTDLIVRGVAVAPITLHTGVSSLEVGETPLAERYAVPEATARAVRVTKEAGGRVIAVGTTVTRALETVAADDATVRPGSGWTTLVLGPDRPAHVVDGIITGWHEPEASHLLLLEAVAGRALVERAYDEALTAGYLWHEFGDSCLLIR